MRKLEYVNCPNCRKEMKIGYIYSSHNISWSDDDKNSFFGFKDKLLVSPPLLKTNKVPAYKYEDCEIVIFEYDSSM